MKKLILMALFGLTLFCIASGQPESASAVLEKSRDLTMVDALEATITLTIADKTGSTRVRQNTMVSKTYSDGTEKRLIRFVSPAEVQGTAILIHDYEDAQDDMWIYLPALRKVRRIVSTEKGRSFMGSEFTNADVSSPPTSDFVNNYLPGSGNKQGEVIIIESIPVDASGVAEYGFSRRISYFEAGTYRMKKMEFFDKGGILYKTIQVMSVIPINDNGHYMIGEMEAVNHVTGRKSMMKMEQVTTSGKPNDSLFDAQNLSR